MAERFNFTKKALEALAPTSGKQAYYYDTKAHGLGLRVSPNNVKTFVLYRKVNGKPERVTLGRFPDRTIEQARNEAGRMNATIAAGENPNDKKRTLRAELTLGDLYTRYLSDHIRALGKSERTLASAWNKHLSAWSKRKLSTISKADVQGLKTRLIKEGMSPGGVNRILGIVSALFGWAVEQDLFRGESPCSGVKKLPALSRDRFLQADELPRFFEALAEEPNTTARDYFLMSLLTGARRANVLAMRWQDVNLERGTWTIPKTKTGEPHTVPLIPEAITLLESRRAAADGPWVFPGPGASRHLVEPKKAWRRILERAGIQDLRIHDLRRSLGSWQAATGANLSIIGKTLAHKNVSTTAIYARLNLDPVRASMEQATRAMFDAAGVLPKADVVNIRKTGSSG